MSQEITPQDVRSRLSRVGLDVSDDRLDRLVRGLQAALVAAAALFALDMGYRGPASLHVPPPADREKIHGN